MKQVDFTISTAGDGLWSEVAKPVRCLNLDMGYIADERDFGELRVYFDTKTWNTREDGLIYTDDAFEEALREELKKLGFSNEAASAVSYSEQGMQGRDYVSLDAGKAFVDEVIKLGVVTEAEFEEMAS